MPQPRQSDEAGKSRDNTQSDNEAGEVDDLEADNEVEEDTIKTVDPDNAPA